MPPAPSKPSGVIRRGTKEQMGKSRIDLSCARMAGVGRLLHTTELTCTRGDKFQDAAVRSGRGDLGKGGPRCGLAVAHGADVGVAPVHIHCPVCLS